MSVTDLFVSAQNLYSFTSERFLEFYVKNYIQRRLRTIHLNDLGSTPFYNDILVWDEIFKRKNDHFDHFFHWRRVRQLIDRHESYLLGWISFVETN